MDVNEGSNLQLQVTMDGNPKPSADFRWPHRTVSSPTNVPSVQLYPFVYSSTYTLNNIDASYCGKILQTTIKNSIGSSSVSTSTNVTVLCKLSFLFSNIYCYLVVHLVALMKFISLRTSFSGFAKVGNRLGIVHVCIGQTMSFKAFGM